MEKIVKSGLRDCTVNLDGSECAVKFDSCFRAFSVRNDSASDVFISKSSGIVPDADGVMCVKSGASAVFAHMDIYANTVYLLGNGRVQLHAQNDSANPFNFAPASDGGVMASGSPVQLDGLQEGIPFSEITVNGKNLIPYPYYDGNSKTHNGITFTVNSDGSVTANGTATAAAIFYISTDFTIKKGMYTLSGCPKSDSNTDYILQFATGDWSFKASDFGNGATILIDNDINLQIFRVAISNGVVCDNLVFRPQLELGSTPTAYEPPITGRELTLAVSGKNLINNIQATGTVVGVTVTKNDDGTVTINGTTTGNLWLLFDDKCRVVKDKTYTFSMGFDASVGIMFGVRSGDNAQSYLSTGTSGSFVAPETGICRIRGYVKSGITFDNLTIYPQLEIGSTATPYEPYNGTEYNITPDNNPYTIPNDIRQQDGLNVVSVSEGELSVVGVRKNAAIKRIWDEIDEIKTAIIVSNGESE